MNLGLQVRVLLTHILHRNFRIVLRTLHSCGKQALGFKILCNIMYHENRSQGPTY